MNSLKNSFIFLETIISLVVVSIIVTIFFKISYNKSDDKSFTKILTISNKLKKSQYENFTLTTKNLKIKKDNITENLLVNQITYSDNSLKLVKYELK